MSDELASLKAENERLRAEVAEAKQSARGIAAVMHVLNGHCSDKDNEIERLATQLRAAAPSAVAPQWQPIETAPKTGLIDVWTASGNRYAGCYYDAICDEWRAIQAGILIRLRGSARATHWMPLPPAPGATPGGQEGES